MQRRSFITAGLALLAAPLAMFRRKAPGFPVGPDTPMLPWKNYTGTYEPQMTPEELEEHAADMKRAAGPWKIVEQTEDGIVRLERDFSVDAEELVVDWFRVAVVEEGKALIDFRFAESSKLGEYGHGQIPLYMNPGPEQATGVVFRPRPFQPR